MLYYRFDPENRLIVAVIPGPRKPYDIFSFLYPTIQELLVLETEGIIVETRTSSIRIKAHLLNIIGDIPGLSELCLHAGHNSYHGCRICKIKGIYSKSKRTIVFPGTNEAQEPIEYPLRTSEDYQNGDLVRSLIN